MSQHPSSIARGCASVLFAATLLATACKTTPDPAKGPPAISFEQKMAWILELEDRRILRKEAPPAPPAEPVRRGRAPQAAPAPPASGDLVVLITDADARIR